MNPKRNLLTQFLFIAWPMVCPLAGNAQSGGPFDLSWHTIDSGGGTSSGGQFTLSGTIGQSDAGVLTGGNFKLEGGFWSGVTVLQTPGVPVLKIKLIAGNQAVISWPASVNDFILEETTSVGGGVWNATPESVVDTATEHTVTVPALGSKCYRLHRSSPAPSKPSMARHPIPG